MPNVSAGQLTTLDGLRRAFGTGLAVFVFAWVCHTIDAATTGIPAVWPVNAIVVASLLSAPPRQWLFICLGGLLGNLLGDVVSGDHWLAAANLSFCNTVEIAICSVGLLKLAGPKPDLFRIRDFWTFAPLCFVASSISALLAITLGMGFVHGASRVVAIWTLGDGLGLLIVTPALLGVSLPAIRMALAPARRWRTLAAVAGLVAVDGAVFAQPSAPLLFIVSAALIVFVFELETFGAALGTLITAVISVSSTLIWLGSSSTLHVDRVGQVLTLQIYLAVTAVLNLAIAVTLSHRRQLRDALSLSETRYRMITDRATDIIIRLDRAGFVEFVSPAVSQLGYQPEAVRGLNLADLAHPDDRAAALASLTGPPQEPGASTESPPEFRVLCADGSWTWLQGAPSPIHDDHGAVIGTVTVFRDVSLRRAMEDELRRKQAEAQAAATAKSDFLANMTHELRTPLSAIVGFSGLLKQSGALNARDQRHVELIADASQTLLGVVNDVLDFSKLDEGGVEFEAHPFDPGQLVEATLSLLAGQAAAKGLTLSAIAEGLDGPLLGDGTRLRQVLLNFVSNAIKFTARGEIQVQFGQSADGDRRRLRIAVRDQGIGVPPEMIDTIFGRFTQGDASVSRKYGGTGLGLAICKRIIEAQGGEIGVVSRIDEGSTFWFEVSMPVAEAALQAELEQPACVDKALRLLVAEDNAVNRELICALLEPFGLDIETVADGVEAVAAVSRSAFDVVLMDVQMPNMDGLTATRRIRANEASSGPRIPIIAMTANVLPDQVARCLEAGMDDHLGKPINLPRLLEALDRWSAPQEDEGPQQQLG